MKTIVVRLLCCGAIAAGLASCEVPGYGYPPSYYGGGPYPNYGHHHEHHDDHHHDDRHPTHCYCSHKSCGCRPGHPKSGCYCDGGRHRH